MLAIIFNLFSENMWNKDTNHHFLGNGAANPKIISKTNNIAFILILKLMLSLLCQSFIAQ